MTGTEFFDALNAAIAPLSIAKMKGAPHALIISLSDGRIIEAGRQKIKNVAADDVGDFIRGLVG